MSLIVSLRIPDGIVLAGDSLSTMRSELDAEGSVTVECPECGHEHSQQVSLGKIGIPTSTFSYAQKVFPFMENFGVGTFGAGQLGGKTMYFAVRELEEELNGQESEIESVDDAADKIIERVKDLLELEVGDLEQLPTGVSVVGFQVVGYREGDAVTLQVELGKQIERTEYDGPGCTYSGQGDVVQAIWKIYKQDETQEPIFSLFSLQDAIEYAQFLIQTTADHQNFSKQMANVGGDIDVALVTPFNGFQWIEQKPLNEKIDRRTHE